MPSFLSDIMTETTSSPLQNETQTDPNSNQTFCSAEQKLVGDLWVQLVFCLMYAIIFCIGVFGNILVSLVVIKNNHMRTVTNVFIVNLAISDVVMCLFAVPFTPLQSFTGRWYFGGAMCKLFPFSQGVSVYISTLTLTIIALDRFVVILYPLRARMQMKTCALLVALIDGLAMFLIAPYAFHVGIVGEDDDDVRCTETWDGLRRTIYGAFTNVTQFLLPFITIIICYTAIIRRLNQRAAERPGGLRRNKEREELERQRNQKTNRMLISMVVAFGICWLPLNTINFLADLDIIQPPIYCWEFHHFTFFVFHVMAMSSTCYNPFLYGLHNEAFQTEFVKLVPFLRVICGNAAATANSAPNLANDHVNNTVKATVHTNAVKQNGLAEPNPIAMV